MSTGQIMMRVHELFYLGEELLDKSVVLASNRNSRGIGKLVSYTSKDNKPSKIRVYWPSSGQVTEHEASELLAIDKTAN